MRSPLTWRVTQRNGLRPRSTSPEFNFDLLAWFVAHPRRVFPREELLQHVWGHTYTGDVRSVDSMVKRLRSRLRLAGAPEDLIVGVRDIGYRITATDLAPY